MISQSVMDGIEGIVLDAVGTLIEPEPSVAIAYAEAAARQGVALDLGEVKRRFHQHFRDDEGSGSPRTDEEAEWRRWRRIVGAVLPEAPDPERAFRELWEHFGRPDSWRVFPDAAAAVGVLSERGFQLRIGSNFDRRLRAIVAGLPALRPLQGDGALVISSEVGYRKPHEAFYRIAREGMGLPGSRVLWVGDDVENDLHAPRRAGLRAVLVDRGGRAVGVSPRVSDLIALAAIVEKA